MKIISYSQNFEDVMLWRALKHVPKGFYIDIGAHDPRIDSVSRLFYEHEWRGIHVEPLLVYCDALRADRPDESVLQAAVAAESGVMRFYEIPHTGISTARADIAETHRSRGFSINEITVPCVTLKHVFDYAGDTAIHWLKIDVEGLEEQVLRSWGDSQARPWIVVVESTLPMTQIQSYELWEQELTKRGYVFRYFDGLNRFYLAESHDELSTAFSVGPNVFDGFSFSGLASAPYCSEVQQQYECALDLKAKEFEAHRDMLHAQLAGAVESKAELLILQEQTHTELVERRAALAGLEVERAHLEAEGARKITALRAQLSESERRFSDELLAEAERRRTERLAYDDLREKHAEKLVEAGQHERYLAAELRNVQLKLVQDAQLREKQVAQFEQVKDDYALKVDAALQRERTLQTKLEEVSREAITLAQIEVAAAQAKTELLALLQKSEIQLAEGKVVVAALEAKQEQLEIESSRKIAELRDKLGESERRFSEELMAEAVRRQEERLTLDCLKQKHSEQLVALQAKQDQFEIESAKKIAELRDKLGESEHRFSDELIAQAVRRQEERLTLERLKQKHAEQLAGLEAKQEQFDIESARKIAELRDQLGESERRFSEELIAEALRRQEENLTLERLKQKHSEQLAVAKQHERDLAAQLRRLQQQLAHDAQTREKQAQQLARVREDHALQIDAAIQRERVLQSKMEDGLREALELTQSKAEATRLGAEEAARQAELFRRDYLALETLHAAQRAADHERLASLEARGALRQQAADECTTALICQLDEFRLMHETQIESFSTRLDQHFDDHRHLQELQGRLQTELDAERQTAARLALALQLTHATLSWRLTLPFRAIAVLVFKKNDSDTSNYDRDEPKVEYPLDSHSGSILVAETQPAQSSSSSTLFSESEMTMTTLSAVGSLTELLSLSDSKFVDAAYLTLLGRAPDAEGRQYYIHRIRMGVTKSRIISQICRSPEGRVFSANLPGLSNLIDKELKSQKPLVGWIYRLMTGAEGDGSNSRKLRTIENQIYILSQESTARFSRLEAAIDSICMLVPKERCGDVLKTKKYLPNPKKLRKSSPRSKAIYSQLMLALAEKTLEGA